MLIGEAGWMAKRDHAAMLHAIHLLQRRKGDRSVLDTLGADIPERAAKYLRRPWLGELDTGCLRPPSFPAHLNWEGVHQYLCVKVVARVRLYLRGKLRNPCRGTPDQWRARGRPKLLKRIRRKGWARIGCGRTLQAYFDTRRRS